MSDNSVKAGCGFVAIAVIFLAIGGVMMFQFVGGCTGIEYGEGTRSGVVQKMSKKGLVWKTWEGELNLGFNVAGRKGQIFPAVFEFSVASNEVAAKLEEAELSGRRVTLHYKQYFARRPDQGATPYDIVGVSFPVDVK